MKIVLTGATGAIGSALTRQLLEAGHSVVGFVRSAAAGEKLQAMGAAHRPCDLLDQEDVGAAIRAERPDAIVHQATALGADIPYTRFAQLFATTNRLRTQGTDNLLSAALDAEVGKLIIQSFCGWPFAKFGPPAAAETHPFDTALPRQQRQACYALQYAEAVVNEAPLDGVALRYGGFYGPGTAVCRGGSIVADIRRRRMPIIGGGTGWWSFVHVEDAAAATVAALAPGVRGIFNIVDDEPAQAREWLPQLAKLAGAPPPLRLPRLIGHLAGAHIVSMMTETRGGLNAKARCDLDWQLRYPSWREGFAASLGG